MLETIALILRVSRILCKRYLVNGWTCAFRTWVVYIPAFSQAAQHEAQLINLQSQCCLQ